MLITDKSLKIQENEDELLFTYRIYQMYYNNLLENINGQKATQEEVGYLINQELFENNYIDKYQNESTYRKPYSYAMKYFDKVFKPMFFNNNNIIELDEKIIEIKKEREKLNATKIEYNRNIRHEARFELFYENIKEAIKTLEPPIFNSVSLQNYDTEEIFAITDIHYGANFTGQNNSYSRQICKDRFEKLLSMIIRDVQREQIGKVKITNLGDSIQGILRISDLKLNETTIVSSVIELSDILANFLNELSKYCHIDYYHVSSANHSQIRPLGSKASELASDDVEKLIVNFIKDKLQNNNRVNVIFDMEKDYLNFKVFDFNFLSMHGHQIKSVSKAMSDYSNNHRVLYDYMLIGHYHAGNEDIVAEGENHNISVITCPSFEGSCPYADTLKVGSKSMVRRYTFDRKYGHIGTKSYILN